MEVKAEPSPSPVADPMVEVKAEDGDEDATGGANASMSTIVNFTPLCGARSCDPLCYLLEVDDCKILLDCGWDAHFDVALLEPLAAIAKDIDAVLISHADVEHLGALPYAVGKLGLSAPIYATTPVHRMGLMFMYDIYLSKMNESDFTLFDLDDVDKALESITQLKYSQQCELTSEKGIGIRVTPFCAGHSLGGALWRIQKETENIVYAVDYNHHLERHLNAGVLETLTRPTLLITDAYGALAEQLRRKDVDKQLISSVMNTLRHRGNVLMPIDTAGRVLELLLVLSTFWKVNKLNVYPLVFMNHVSYNTAEFAQSSLEWMSVKVSQMFHQSRENPFSMEPYVHLCHDMNQLRELSTAGQPMVVLASMADLECGFARELFIKWAPDPKNLIIFTDRSRKGFLAWDVMNKGTQDQEMVLSWGQRVPLAGEELQMHRAQQEAERVAAEAEAQRAKMEMELLTTGIQDDEEDDDIDMIDKADPNAKLFESKYDVIISENGALPMFPIARNELPSSENPKLWSQFGLEVPVHELGPSAAAAAEEARKAAEAAAQRTDTDLELMKAKEDVPTKCMTFTSKVRIRAKVEYMNFEGRCDGRSIEMILGRILPQRVILIHGVPAALQKLADHCERSVKISAVCKSIQCPNIGETVNATSETNVFRMQLTDSLLRKLKWEAIDDYQCAFVDGKLHMKSLQNREIPTIESLTGDDHNGGHSAVYLGQLNLKKYESVLQEHGFQCMFDQGTLIVNGYITIRKQRQATGQSTVQIDGPMCPDYYRIRQLLYSQFKIL